jgi:hypothetical protein
MIQIGNGPNAVRQYGGYQPVSGFFSFVTQLRGVRDKMGMTVPFYVPLSSEDDLNSLIGIMQLYSPTTSVDVWGMGYQSDWRVRSRSVARFPSPDSDRRHRGVSVQPLRRIANGGTNGSNVLVQMTQSSYDWQYGRQNETLQALGLQYQWDQIMAYGNESISGIIVSEWSDVYQNPNNVASIDAVRQCRRRHLGGWS